MLSTQLLPVRSRYDFTGSIMHFGGVLCTLSFLAVYNSADLAKSMTTHIVLLWQYTQEITKVMGHLL